MATPTVQNYYDSNTAAFLKRGQHEHTRNIHQPLWAPGITKVADAANWSNQLVLTELRAATTLHAGAMQVLDLGCGVGSSLLYLARHAKQCRYHGVTISPVQAALAQGFAEQEEAGGSCEFFQGDFLELPSLPPIDFAYAIEAFLHATDAAKFFAQIASNMREGAALVLIDDVRTERNSLGSKEKQWLRDFRSGWLAGSLLSVDQIHTLAARSGLILQSSEDLTPLMRIGRLRDKGIGLLRLVAAPLMRRSTYFRALNGGYAKQQCLRHGIVQYRKLVFVKQPES